MMKKIYFKPEIEIVVSQFKSGMLEGENSGVLRGQDTMANEGNSFEETAEDFSTTPASLWDD